MNKKILGLLGFYMVDENCYQLDFNNEGISFCYYLDLNYMVKYIDGIESENFNGIKNIMEILNNYIK